MQLKTKASKIHASNFASKYDFQQKFYEECIEIFTVPSVVKNPTLLLINSLLWLAWENISVFLDLMQRIQSVIMQP